MNSHLIIVFTLLFLLQGCAGQMPKIGVESGKLKACPSSPNCVCSQYENDEHFIRPIRFTGSLQGAKSKIIQVLGTMKEARVIVDNDDYIHAEFVSKIFRFVDDVEFYFPPTNNEEVRIEVRSASRVGRSDFGVNRKRIEKIRSLVEGG